MRKILFAVTLLLTLNLFASANASSDRLIVEIKDILDLATYETIAYKKFEIKKDREEFYLLLTPHYPKLEVIVTTTKVDENRYSVRIVKNLMLVNKKIVEIADKHQMVIKNSSTQSSFQFSDFYRDEDNIDFVRQLNIITLE